jgi:hypothetical protein
MGKIDNPRKRAFRTALALADTTMKAWAAEQGVSLPHLYLVLMGQRVSAPLNAKIDAFIAQNLARLIETCRNDRAAVA